MREDLAHLPYFYNDLQAAFLTNMKKVQRANLAAFTARLVFLGVFDNKLFTLRLILFRDAFKTLTSSKYPALVTSPLSKI